MGLYVEQWLYDTNRRVLPRSLSDESMYDFLETQDCAEGNYVCYRAKPSTSHFKYSYYGMDLEVETATVGSFNVEEYERLLQEALAREALEEALLAQLVHEALAKEVLEATLLAQFADMDIEGLCKSTH